MIPYFVIIVNKHADSEQQIGIAVTPKGTLRSHFFPQVSYQQFRKHFSQRSTLPTTVI